MIMLEYIKYSRKLRSLTKKLDETNSFYSGKIREAEKKKEGREEVDSLISEAIFEESMLKEEISIHVTNYLAEYATKHFISIPDRDEEGMWQKCRYMSERRVLTNKGISKLRSLIRSENKEKIESLSVILASITGVIGAITGLIAVLN